MDRLFYDKEAINQLFKEYGYYEAIVEEAAKIPGTFWELSSENTLRKSLPLEFYIKKDEFLDEYQKQNPDELLELAKLIDFFRSVDEGMLTISGIVLNPRHGEVKGGEKRITIQSLLISSLLEDFLSKLLYQQALHEYFFHFGRKWESFYDTMTIRYRVDGGIPQHDKDCDGEFLGFTEEGLDAILKYEEEKRKNRDKYTKNARKGKVLATLYNRMKQYGIVGQEGHPTQHEYCFLYDYMVIAGVEKDQGMYDRKGPAGKDKYQVVRKYIKAFETQSNK